MQMFILYLTLSLFTEIATAKNPQECFDILSTIPTTQQRKFYEMSFKETANATVTNDMLTCFLKALRYSDDENYTIEKYFDIYKKCSEFQQNTTDEPLGMNQLNELKQLGLQQSLVSYLQDGIKSGNKAYIEESISYITDAMAKYIEPSQEFKDYKKSILRKIGGQTKPKAQQFPNHEESLLQIATFSKRSGQKSSIIVKSIYTLPQSLSYLMIIVFFL